MSSNGASPGAGRVQTPSRQVREDLRERLLGLAFSIGASVAVAVAFAGLAGLGR